MEVIKTKNKKRKGKRGILLGNHTVNLVVTAIVAVFLVYLAIQVYLMFTEENKLKNAEAQLEKLVEVINRVYRTGESETVEIFAPGDKWVLRTFTETGDFPGAKCKDDLSCLCFCSSEECDESVTCEGFRLGDNDDFTDVFISPLDSLIFDKPIRDLEISERKKETKDIIEIVDTKYEKSFLIKLIKMDSEGIFILKIGSATPLYYRFNKETEGWEWSPDRQNWMSTSTTEVKGGTYDGRNPTKGNIEIINSLDRLNPTPLEVILISLGNPDSEGIYATKIGSATSIYYRLNKETEGWEWSPDRQNWMSTSATKVKGGKYDGRSPVKGNIEIINSLDRLNPKFYHGNCTNKD